MFNVKVLSLFVFSTVLLSGCGLFSSSTETVPATTATVEATATAIPSVVPTAVPSASASGAGGHVGHSDVKK